MTFFNAENEQAKLINYDAVPAGSYIAHITDCTIEMSEDGYELIKIQYLFDDPKAKGKALTDTLCINALDATYQSKSRAKLKLLCDVKGLKVLNGPADLAHFVGMTVRLTVGVYLHKETKEPRNSIKDIESPNAPEKVVLSPVAQNGARTSPQRQVVGLE